MTTARFAQLVVETLITGSNPPTGVYASGGGLAVVTGSMATSGSPLATGGGIAVLTESLVTTGAPVTGFAASSGGGVARAFGRALPPPPAPLLGCGSWEVFILSRGGGTTVGRVEIESGSFTRVLDDLSTATVRVPTRNGPYASDCCATVRDIKPWKHELQIRRDGVEVWVGPIREKHYVAGVCQITATDLTAWWDKRLLRSEDHDYDEESDVSDIVIAMHADAMSRDPSPNFTVTKATGSIPFGTTLFVDPAELKSAGDSIRELARASVDYTAIRRDVLLRTMELDTATQARKIATLVDEHWVGEPEIIVSGDDQGTRWIVQGAGGGAAGAEIYGTAIEDATGAVVTVDVDEGPLDASDPYELTIAQALASPQVAEYGLVEKVVSESSVQEGVDAARAAKSKLELAGDPPTYIQGGQLATNAPVTPSDLIPGAHVRVLLRDVCERVNSEYRLQTVTFELSRDGEAIAENVSIELTPLGTVSE